MCDAAGLLYSPCFVIPDCYELRPVYCPIPIRSDASLLNSVLVRSAPCFYAWATWAVYTLGFELLPYVLPRLVEHIIIVGPAESFPCRQSTMYSCHL